MGGVPGTFSRRKESQAPVPRALEGSWILNVPTRQRSPFDACRREQQPAPANRDSKQYPAAVTRDAREFPSTLYYRAHRGVPGLTLCLRCLSGCATRTAQCHTGQPPRLTAPVHISKPRGRPPAGHRRGRSSPRFPRATTPMVRRSGASDRRRPRRPVF
jgi:hypothetical protein